MKRIWKISKFAFLAIFISLFSFDKAKPNLAVQSVQADVPAPPGDGGCDAGGCGGQDLGCADGGCAGSAAGNGSGCCGC